MKLMKKVLISTSLFSAALLISASSFASGITLYNNDFDALVLEDGNSSDIVHNWEITSGLAGIHNPSNQMFSGESGASVHENTLYMINDSTVSQTLTFKALEFSTYELSFDVGQRIDVPAQNYSIKVMAGNTNLLWATNPDLPSTPGSFKHVNVQFATEGLPDDYITVEIETEGTGHLHFDNFELTFELAKETQTDYYRTVGHYVSTTNTDTQDNTCRTLSSFKQANGNPYVSDSCVCQNSKSAWVGSSTSFDGELHHRYYQCVTESSR